MEIELNFRYISCAEEQFVWICESGVRNNFSPLTHTSSIVLDERDQCLMSVNVRLTHNALDLAGIRFVRSTK